MWLSQSSRVSYQNVFIMLIPIDSVSVKSGKNLKIDRYTYGFLTD